MIAQCMRGKPFATIVRAQIFPEYLHDPYDNDNGGRHFNVLPWVPAIGDELLPMNPLAAFNGSTRTSSLSLPLDELEGLLIGSVGRETAAFYVRPPSLEII